MADVATTKLSSKGQVVIPENIREKLRLEAGVQFVYHDCLPHPISNCIFRRSRLALSNA